MTVSRDCLGDFRMIQSDPQVEPCQACAGTGLTPCNGTDTGWCECEFCGGTKVFARPPYAPSWLQNATSEEFERAYLRCAEWRREWEPNRGPPLPLPLPRRRHWRGRRWRRSAIGSSA